MSRKRKQGTQEGNESIFRRPVGVSRVRAAALARSRVARELIACDVYEVLPAGYSVYGLRPPPKKCWYVVCGADTRNTLDGPPKILLCISKRTGRILRRLQIRSGG